MLKYANKYFLFTIFHYLSFPLRIVGKNILKITVLTFQIKIIDINVIHLAISYHKIKITLYNPPSSIQNRISFK